MERFGIVDGIAMLGLALGWSACVSGLPPIDMDSDAQGGQGGSAHSEHAGDDAETTAHAADGGGNGGNGESSGANAGGTGAGAASVKAGSGSNSKAGSGSAGSASGAGGAGGAGTQDGASSSDDPCGAADAIDNDTRDTATPYTPGTDFVGCISRAGEGDYYEFAAPAGESGDGYFTGSIVPTGGTGRPEIYMWAASDNTQIRDIYTSDLGSTLYFYLAVAPGQKYRMLVQDFVFNKPHAYTLRLDYHQVEDPFEPNDTRDQAAALPLNDEVEAYFFAGHKTQTIRAEEFQDWYALDLTGGTLSVTIADVATDVTATAQVFDAAGTAVGGNVSASNKGANLTMMRTIGAPGPYKLVVSVQSTPSTAGKASQQDGVPDHFSRPYKLSATQP